METLAVRACIFQRVLDLAICSHTIPHPPLPHEVNGNIVNLKFPGRRQQNTPVKNARGIAEIIMFLPGEQAARVRRQEPPPQISAIEVDEAPPEAPPFPYPGACVK